MKADLEIISNAGPNTVEATLQDLARSARTLQAVIAFATKAGVEAALPHFRRIAVRGHARITVGLYQGITDPSALRGLANAMKTTNGRLDVRISCNPTLHRKLYVFGFAKKTALLVGSSNLSSGGLWSDGEFNVLLYLPSAGAVLRNVPELADLEKETQPLTPQFISEYERLRNRPQPWIVTSELRSLLKSRPIQSSTTDPQEAGWFRHGITGFVHSKTEAVIARETGWDRRGWDWCTIDRDDRLNRGDFVLLFDYKDRQPWARVVVVKDTTKTAMQTPDGRCFFAHAETRRHFRKKKVTKALFDTLAAEGWRLRKKDSEDTRRLSQPAISAVKQVFKR